MMRNRPDYVVDIAGLRTPAVVSAGGSARPWIAVRWRCCRTYSRVYRNAAGTAYEGRCPRCLSRVRAAVGAGGVDQRFFEAG